MVFHDRINPVSRAGDTSIDVGIRRVTGGKPECRQSNQQVSVIFPANQRTTTISLRNKRKNNEHLAQD